MKTYKEFLENFSTHSSLGGITGMGGVTTPGSPGDPRGFYGNSAKGSGDKLPIIKIKNLDYESEDPEEDEDDDEDGDKKRLEKWS